MVDHQGSAPRERQSNQQSYHSQFQSQYRNKYHQDFHGPLSAGVIEGGQRAFAGFHNHSLPYPPQYSSSSLSSSTALPSSSSSSSLTTSRGGLSVADILERYKDASKDFVMSVLNAKAKEDERKAEEERYKTEQVKLQSKQLELDLALGKRRGSPPAYGSSGQYPYYNSSYSSYSSDRLHRSSSNGNTNSKHPHHESTPHTPHEQDHPQSTHQSSKYSHHDQHMSQPSPHTRPPLKINTSVRQYHQQPQSSQRLPPSPHSTLPPLPVSNPPKSSRHFGLPSMASSAQSSPVAVVDYQSHIPPPLTPKEEHVSPTSAISPTHTLKRKSVNHDAVMDAVRAKVLRNAAGQNQQQQQQQRKDSERDLSSKRKNQLEKSSPELAKINETDDQEDRSERSDSKLEGPLLSSLPSSNSPPGAEPHSISASPTSLSTTKPRGQANLEANENTKALANDSERRRNEHTKDKDEEK